MQIAKLLLQVTYYGALLAGVHGTVSPAAAQSAAMIVTEKPAPLAESAEQPKTAAAAELPDSPGATVSKSQPSPTQPVSSGKLPDAPDSFQLLAMQTVTGPQQPESAQSQDQTTQREQPPAQQPVGTAAAGVVPADGIAASQPAGVAIAPAKQRRVRTLVLRMGAIIGTGVAVGSVVALTQATSSKPPGAH